MNKHDRQVPLEMGAEDGSIMVVGEGVSGNLTSRMTQEIAKRMAEEYPELTDEQLGKIAYLASQAAAFAIKNTLRNQAALGLHVHSRSGHDEETEVQSFLVEHRTNEAISAAIRGGER